MAGAADHTDPDGEGLNGWTDTHTHTHTHTHTNTHTQLITTVQERQCVNSPGRCECALCVGCSRQAGGILMRGGAPLEDAMHAVRD